MQLKIDLHVHTCYSSDSLITAKELVFYAKKHKLDGVAITDHDEIKGALEIAEDEDFFIIPGMEITTLDGHVLALNIQQPVPKGLSATETANKIHEAGGIAVACHPSAFFKGSLGKHTSSSFDAVEVINASALPFARSVKHAQRLASNIGIPQVAGTDAHYGPEIGYAYTLVDAELKADDVIKAISKGLCQPFGKAIPWTLRLKKELLTLRKALTLSPK